jgi:hypothetical protein
VDCGYGGWCSFGFGGDDMINVDLVAIVRDGDKVDVSDHYSTAFAPPKLDTALGGTEDYTLESFSLQAETYTANFTRKLDTGDKYDFPLVVNMTTTYIYAY